MNKTLKYLSTCWIITLFSFGSNYAYSQQFNQSLTKVPKKKNVWVFFMAGQSNMAGRATVQPQDTVTNPRILTINIAGQLVLAKEPLHFYEPSMAGLDCGLSFGGELLKHIPDSIAILIIPTAIGGSSIDKWLGDSLFRQVKLFSNFQQKCDIGNKYGIVKGILWHQGESDATKELATNYQNKLKLLFAKFRTYLNNNNLPILTGEIGTFAENHSYQDIVNNAIRQNTASDKHTYLIKTRDFSHRGDQLHFNSRSQRLMGERFALAYIQCYRLKN